MKKLGALLLLLCLSSCLAPPARTQNVQCPNRPIGDSTNACANTRFVIQNSGGGGGGSPGGTNGQIQYNNSSAFGGFTLSGDCTIPTIAAGAITCNKLNNVSPGTIWTQNSNNVSITGGTINGAIVTGLAAPSAGSDAVNKTYADGIASGFFPLSPVVAATTTTLPANTYANGASGVGATLTGNANGALAAQDGVTLIVTNRLLVKNEAALANNGCYTLTTVGDGSNPYVLTRCTDFDTAAEMLAGRVFGITFGSVQAAQNWYNTTTTATVGTTAVVFAILSGSQWTTSGVDIQNNNSGTVNIATTLTMGGNILLNGHWLSGDGGNEGLFVTSAGNVGLGTSSPAAAGTGAVAGRSYLTASGSTGAGSFEMITQAADADGNIVGVLQYTDKNNAVSDKRVAGVFGGLSGTTANSRGGFLRFDTKPDGASGITERMRITRDGNVGIGTTTPAAQLNTTGSVRLAGVASGAAGLVAIAANGDLSRTGGGNIFYPAAACDGVTDNTAVIQNSLTSATALGGAIVELPYGQCLSGALTIGFGTWFRGQTSGSYRGLANGTTLLAKTGISQLITITGLGSHISDMWIRGNATAGWGIINNPGNSGGDSIATPSLVTDTAITDFRQAGAGGIINQSGTIHIERSQFNNNCFAFYSFDANISGRFLKNDVEFGGQCGWQAIWSRDGGNVNEGQIIRDNQFLGSQGEGVWIKNCLLCWFENNVIGSTSGARDLAITTGDAMHIIGNWGDKNVEIITNERSWYHRNSIRSTGGLSISGPWLSMFNIVTTGTCSLGAGVTALINANAACNNTSSVPSTW